MLYVWGTGIVSVFGMMIGWELVLHAFCPLHCLGLCPTKKLQSEYFVWEGNLVSWNISVRTALHQPALVLSESLSSLLSNVVLCRDATDFRIWKPHSAGLFSSRSFYKEIDPFSAVTSPCTAVWMPGWGLFHLEWRLFASW